MILLPYFWLILSIIPFILGILLLAEIINERIVSTNSWFSILIPSPYLILSSELNKALILAAKRGVDLRIVVPKIADKKIVYSLSASYFPKLIENGVKIYTYTPGFMHSKVFVADDKVATVGTFNLDYRSLYLHFECGVYMEDVNEIKNIKKDLTDAIKKSRLLTMEDTKAGFFKQIWQSILRLIAPLM